MHLTLRQMRIFEAVARHSSISRAAAELHLTQPAVSMQIKQLEEQIGLPLLEHIGKRLFLTDAGLELRAHAKRFAAQTVDLKNAMDQYRGLQRGVLRLAGVSTASYFLPALIASLSARHPGMRISLQVANREAVLGALADNRTDLAITGQPPDSAELVAQHFMDNPLVVIAAPSHPLANLDSIPMRRLSHERLVVREPGSGTRAAIERHFTAHGAHYLPGCEINADEAIKQAVQANLGLGIISAQAIELELETRRLAVLPVEGFPIIRRWYIVNRRDKRLSAAATAFKELLLEHSWTPRSPRKDVISAGERRSSRGSSKPKGRALRRENAASLPGRAS
jgi:DNA-binding transcriptional LysR family regulator